MIALKRQVVEALMADSEWRVKLEKAETMREVERVLREFAEKKGYRVAEVKVKP